MFNTIDVPTNDSQIRQFWHKLIRVIQTELEHKRVTNGSVASLVKGDLLYAASGDRVMRQAVNSTAAQADWVCVASEPIAASERGIARTEGYGLVRFVTGLTMVEGVQVYVSDTAGAATNVAPDDPDYTSVVGILGNADDYTDLNPYAYVFLGHCCPGTVVAAQ